MGVGNKEIECALQKRPRGKEREKKLCTNTRTKPHGVSPELNRMTPEYKTPNCEVARAALL